LTAIEGVSALDLYLRRNVRPETLNGRIAIESGSNGIGGDDGAIGNLSVEVASKGAFSAAWGADE
jgi:hypothetical protein